MAMITTDYADRQGYLGAVGPAAGPAGVWNGAKLILGTNQFQPSKTLLLAGITQPTYVGYAAQTITWAGPFRDPLGNQAAFGSTLTFNETGAITATTCYGYGITDSAGTNLLASELFVTPLSLTDAFSVIRIMVLLCLVLNNVESAVVTS